MCERSTRIFISLQALDQLFAGRGQAVADIGPAGNWKQHATGRRCLFRLQTGPGERLARRVAAAPENADRRRWLPRAPSRCSTTASAPRAIAARISAVVLHTATAPPRLADNPASGSPASTGDATLRASSIGERRRQRHRATARPSSALLSDAKLPGDGEYIANRPPTKGPLAWPSSGRYGRTSSPAGNPTPRRHDFDLEQTQQNITLWPSRMGMLVVIVYRCPSTDIAESRDRPCNFSAQNRAVAAASIRSARDRKQFEPRRRNPPFGFSQAADSAVNIANEPESAGGATNGETTLIIRCAPGSSSRQSCYLFCRPSSRRGCR